MTSITAAFPRASSRLLDFLQLRAERLRWGVRSVGLGPTLRGAFRLTRLKLARPRRSEIRLASGPVLEFDYPSQFPRALVGFGDLIDPEFEFLRLVLRPGATVVDAGAAIGQFSLFSATLGAARIHAFEPSGANVATLRRNVERNGAATRVSLHQVALSDSEGEAFFTTEAATWTSHLSLEGQGRGERVPVRRLDDEFERLGLERIDLLKVNVAGYEPGVLAGADPLLAAGRISMLVLLLGLESLPCYARMAQQGYRFFYFHPLRRTLYEVRAFDASSVLDHRPWPARHILAIHRSEFGTGPVSALPIEPL